ncbi:transcriptional regulator with XRE-family HTH domain [Nocardiopsis mwathae]|uniref:Transcriptional regulator with XRE-family HTH domain n=1 Tax=Nocardiopsis mwathae TaxID=1472723 RepID=A0A7W9YMD8_9ACTN|nr:helix-turn-helix transcriptional regulator [Nocardiopsis mwathae]MBB6174660.1 transcriptional regulator with XRE-family HTH domain [Nocardiopsis mwathae]
MPTSPTVRRRQLSAELRRLRLAAGLTLDAVAEALETSRGKISHIETGRRKKPSIIEVTALLDLYQVKDPQQRTAVLDLARQSRETGWWTKYDDVFTGAYVGLEAEATHIQTYEPMGVPGLLQTPEYAAEIATASLKRPADVDRHVEARTHRQELLTKDDAPEVWAIMEETSLLRLARWPELLRGQVEHLLAAATAPGPVTLQLVPLHAGLHPGVSGAFVVMQFETAPTVVYCETLTDGLYVERAEEIDAYRRAFDHLQGFALSTRETVARLRELLP